MHKTCCLGWGSLIWDPRDLESKIEKWNLDGPFLPIEFTRQSNDGRITLIIDEQAKPIQTLWTKINDCTLDEAREVLRIRENTPDIKRIHWISVNENPENNIKKIIQDWLNLVGMDSAIWTGLGYKFNKIEERPSIDKVIDYLKGLKGEIRADAEEYIRKAPTQIDTEYRKAIESEFGWTPK